MRNEIIQGDALTVLKTLPDEYIQCVVTSPPYFNLRDYGTGQWEGGDPECDHLDEPIRTAAGFNERYFGKKYATDKQGETRHPFRVSCGKCGATRIDQQIGLEETPGEYIERLVEVFREIRRVLRRDGTVWLNLGDSYAGSGKGPTGYNGIGNQEHKQGFHSPPVIIPDGLKPKDLMGIPWRVALALQDDGWYFRSDIIWAKNNCMPESVTDRPTKSHEYLFLFSKSERYFYDYEAIKEPAKDWGTRDRSQGKYTSGVVPISGGAHHGLTNSNNASTGRNKRSVWAISTQPYEGAHFAVMPEDLVEPCVLAGASPRACEICGAPWKRVILPTGTTNKREPAHAPFSSPTKTDSTGWMPTRYATNQWHPTCKHENQGIGKSLVLDPFMGSGTVALVAIKHGRDYLGIELNQEYIHLIKKRIAVVQPDLWTVEGEVAV